MQAYAAVEVSYRAFWTSSLDGDDQLDDPAALSPSKELLGTEDAYLLGCYVVSAVKLDCLAVKLEALYSFETSVTSFPVDTIWTPLWEPYIEACVPVEWEADGVPEMIWALWGRVDLVAFARDRTPITGSSSPQPSTLQVQTYV